LYALAARALDREAVLRVFDMKGREPGKPLPLFVADLAMAERYAVIDARARRLAERFWPGALTMVFAKRASFDSEALSGGGTVALRVPAHDIAREVIAGLGEPITATSANLSGGREPDTAEEVRRQLGDRLDLVLDAGPCAIGVSSTIVDCSTPELRVLRYGAIAETDVRAALEGLA
jgi:L-threonylcarbamoyladenylate synthase